MRVSQVRRFDAFELMLEECGLGACLPGVASMPDGVAIYRQFPGFHSQEVAHGVVAFDIQPVVGIAG